MHNCLAWIALLLSASLDLQRVTNTNTMMRSLIAYMRSMNCLPAFLPASTDPPPPPGHPACAALQVPPTQSSCLAGCFCKGWMHQPRGTKLQRGGTHSRSWQRHAAARVRPQAKARRALLQIPGGDHWDPLPSLIVW